MKLSAGISLLLTVTLASTVAVAQIQPGTFKHVVIVFQENRTPDNLFGSSPAAHLGCGIEDPFETGVDIENGGPNDKAGQPNPTCNVSTPLGSSCDPNHIHQSFQNMYHGGAMDGACSTSTQWCDPNVACPQYAYVPKTDVQPYFDIATNYGFANYFFQTNEGPSFPAHQFIFSGTSAPDYYGNANQICGTGTECYKWFAADNPEGQRIYRPGDHTGCTAPANEFVRLIDPSGVEKSSTFCQNNVGNKYCLAPCYEHAPSPYTYGTLGDLLLNQTVSWKYYTPMIDPNTGNIESGLWVAPIAIKHLCGAGYNSQHQYVCLNLLPGGTYANNMRYETTANPYPLVDDINNCSLPAVSWAIPDKRWSDHGGDEPLGLGPAYVANIVNAIGGSPCTDGTNGPTYWQDTAILIVWDDWGGWFDHVNPNPYPGVNQQQGTWGAYYTYGFRVPMMVVSAYTGVKNQDGTYSGYVSGACGGSSQPTCPNLNAPFVHDFGSILAFIEWNFGITIGSIGQGYPFADNYAPEYYPNHSYVPLLDFFPLTQARTFVPIAVPTPYSVNYFQNYFTNNPSEIPDGPDANDND